MTTLQIQKLRMYMALRVLLGANLAILERLPNANELLTALDKAIADIQANIVLQEKSGEKQKNQHDSWRKNVVQDMLDASRKMQAFADAKKDAALLKDTRFSETKLSSMKDIELVKTAKWMHSIVDAYLNELAPFQLTAETQAKLMNDTMLYEASIPQKEKAELDQKNVTHTLGENYKTADKLVSSFDKLVEIVHITDAQFYADYKAMRKIEVPVDVVQLVAKITDAETGAGIPKATVTLTPADDTSDPIVKQTAEKGGFQLKTIATGVYTVTVVKIGYITHTASVTLPGDQPYNLTIRMVKS